MSSGVHILVGAVTDFMLRKHCRKMPRGVILKYVYKNKIKLDKLKMKQGYLFQSQTQRAKDRFSHLDIQSWQFILYCLLSEAAHLHFNSFNTWLSHIYTMENISYSRNIKRKSSQIPPLRTAFTECSISNSVHAQSLFYMSLSFLNKICETTLSRSQRLAGLCKFEFPFPLKPKQTNGIIGTWVFYWWTTDDLWLGPRLKLKIQYLGLLLFTTTVSATV